jgi:hypothetical protein
MSNDKEQLKERILCPSSDCRPGATLLGLVMPDGRVAFAKDRIVVDAEFVERAKQGRSPEQRFRFSSGCVEKACKQWDGCRCGVIETILDEVQVPESELPECTIRPDCRWFRQRGAESCAVCPLILTDMMS